MLLAAVYFGELSYGAGSAFYGEATALVGDFESFGVGGPFTGSFKGFSEKNSKGIFGLSFGVPYAGYGLGIWVVHLSGAYSFKNYGVSFSVSRYSHSLISESDLRLTASVPLKMTSISGNAYIGLSLKGILLSLGSDEYVALDPVVSPESIFAPTLSLSMLYRRDSSGVFLAVENLYPSKIGFFSDERLALAFRSAASVKKGKLTMFGSISYSGDFFSFKAGADFAFLPWASFGVSTSGGSASLALFLKYLRYSIVFDLSGVGGTSHYLSVFYAF